MTFLGTDTKPPYPAEEILDGRQLFFLAVPPWPVIKMLCPSRTIFSTWRWSIKVYQTSIGQGYKGKGNNNKGGFTKLKTSKRYKWIFALNAAFVQQDQIQREVSRWFTYLTDRTSGCNDKKSACYGRIFYWCTCLTHSSQSSQFIFCWNFLYNF